MAQCHNNDSEWAHLRWLSVPNIDSGIALLHDGSVSYNIDSGIGSPYAMYSLSLILKFGNQLTYDGSVS